MRHRVITWCAVLLACVPARSTTPASRATAPTTTDASNEPRPPPPRAEAEHAAVGTYCRVEIEIRETDRARGSAISDTSSQAAHDEAWQRACTELRSKHGLDCEDDTRVRIVSRASSTSLTTDEHGTRQARYEQTFELAAYRIATADAHSDRSFTDACSRAAEHACRATLDHDCPPGGFTILRVEGEDDASHRPTPRRTI